jgi:hypothetical protein
MKPQIQLNSHWILNGSVQDTMSPSFNPELDEQLFVSFYEYSTSRWAV